MEKFSPKVLPGTVYIGFLPLWNITNRPTQFKLKKNRRPFYSTYNKKLYNLKIYCDEQIINRNKLPESSLYCHLVLE